MSQTKNTGGASSRSSSSSFGSIYSNWTAGSTSLAARNDTATTLAPPTHATSPIGFLLVSVDACVETNTRFFCKYTALLVLCGYICHCCVFPLILHRMHRLGARFRNQYNISFLWLCSMLLVTCIDLLEFMLIGDGRVYSTVIVLLLCIYFLFCFTTLIAYVRQFSAQGTAYQNGLTALFSGCVLVIMLVARIWSNRTLSKFPDLDEKSPWMFHILNTHFFIYYFVYALFACVQVYQNFKNEFARCFSNNAYAAWALASVFYMFYTSLLPKRPSYDYIHYRNYFLITTIVVIVLQEINFIRVRINRSNERNTAIKSVCMTQMGSKATTAAAGAVAQASSSYYNSLKFVDTAFEPNSNSQNGAGPGGPSRQMMSDDGEEDIAFDRSQFQNGSGMVRNNLNSQPDMRRETDPIQISMPRRFNSTQSRLLGYINANQTRFVVLFVVVLVGQLVVSTVVLFKSVTFSHYMIITPLLQPIVLIFSLIFKNYSCNFGKNVDDAQLLSA